MPPRLRGLSRVGEVLQPDSLHVQPVCTVLRLSTSTCLLRKHLAQYLLPLAESLPCAQFFTPAISDPHISPVRSIISLSDKETGSRGSFTASIIWNLGYKPGLTNVKVHFFELPAAAIRALKSNPATTLTWRGQVARHPRHTSQIKGSKTQSQELSQ